MTVCDISYNLYSYYIYIIVAGASLVQWNRLNENIIASAPDSDIRIWDLRVSITVISVGLKAL